MTEFAIDTANPSVTDVTVNDLMITDADVGTGTFTRGRDVQRGDGPGGDADADLRAGRGRDAGRRLSDGGTVARRA